MQPDLRDSAPLGGGGLALRVRSIAEIILMHFTNEVEIIIYGHNILLGPHPECHYFRHSRCTGIQ